MSSMVSKMKEQIKKSGANKKEILYFGEGSVKRVRFLQELDDAIMFAFHNDFATKVWGPCRDQSGDGDCNLCRDGVGIQENFILSVWDYDSNSVRLVQVKATGVSPIPALIEMYEEFGTVLDRDYKIKKVGKGQGSSFVVTPLEKERFKGKGKPYNEKEVQDIIFKAWPSDVEEDEEEAPKKKGSKKEKPSKKKVPTTEEKLGELSFKELKEIALELGMTKKEIKEFEDEEELAEELLESYEEADILEILEEMEEE